MFKVISSENLSFQSYQTKNLLYVRTKLRTKTQIFQQSYILLELTQKPTVTRKFPNNSNGLHGEVDLQLSLYGLLLLIQPIHSLEQHTRADLEFSSDFAKTQRKRLPTSKVFTVRCVITYSVYTQPHKSIFVDVAN